MARPETVKQRNIEHILRLDNIYALNWKDDSFKVLHLPVVGEITPKQFQLGTAHLHAHERVLIQGHTGSNLAVVMALAYAIEYEGLTLATAFTRMILQVHDVYPESRFIRNLVVHYKQPYDRDRINRPGFLESLVGEAQSNINEVLPNLYIGSVLALKKQDKIRELGITGVLRLDRIKRQMSQWDDDFTLKDLPLPDHAPLSAENLHKGIDFIHEQHQAGNKVFVHCQMGVSRASTFTIGYLVKYKNMNLAQAYRTVYNARPIINPSWILLSSLVEHLNLPYTHLDVTSDGFLTRLLAEANTAPS